MSNVSFLSSFSPSLSSALISSAQISPFSYTSSFALLTLLICFLFPCILSLPFFYSKIPSLAGFPVVGFSILKCGPTANHCYKNKAIFWFDAALITDSVKFRHKLILRKFMFWVRNQVECWQELRGEQQSPLTTPSSAAFITVVPLMLLLLTAKCHNFSLPFESKQISVLFLKSIF